MNCNTRIANRMAWPRSHGTKKCSTLFKDHTKVQETVQLWRDIATHYKDCPEIAGYDLLNEPMAAANHAELYVVYEKIYSAIRAVDKKHIIFMEDGFKGFEYIPTPAHVGWQNVSYSMHAYAFGQKSDEECLREYEKNIAKFDKYKGLRDVPFYLGKFNVEPAGSALTVQKILSLIEAKGISWSFWMYKIVTSHEERTSMGGSIALKKA